MMCMCAYVARKLVHVETHTLFTNCRKAYAQEGLLKLFCPSLVIQGKLLVCIVNRACKLGVGHDSMMLPQF